MSGSELGVTSYDPKFTPTTRDVRIPALGWDIAATLLLPEGFDEHKTYPVIVCAHPIGSCKEQTAGNVYGAALAREGYVAIAFDASFQGASGGEPRFVENPGQRSADFSQVVDWLVTQDFVDADRIGVLGICGGGGYSINATMADKRFKAVVSVTGVNFGRLINEGFCQYQPVSFLEKVGQQRTAEARGAEQQVTNYLPESVAAAKKQGGDPDLVGAADYYLTDRGRQPHGCTRALLSYQSQAMVWDAFNRAETLLSQPILVAVGDVPGSFGAYRDGMEIYARAASPDKELLVVPGKTHYELYDEQEAVTAVLEKAIPFLATHI